MAIVVERKSKKINWFALAIGLFALVFVGGTVYFLFLLQPPGIEKIIPPPPEANVVKGVKEIIGSVNIQSVIEKVKVLDFSKKNTFLRFTTPLVKYNFSKI